jgi:hypothetical protein
MKLYIYIIESSGSLAKMNRFVVHIFITVEQIIDVHYCGGAFFYFYLNPGQPRTLLQLKLVGILTRSRKLRLTTVGDPPR